jgi:hypothetical protein
MEKKQTHIPYGFVIGIIMVAISLTLYLTGSIYKPGMKWISWLVYVPFLIGMILNANAYSKANNADITFGNAFGSCFKASMIIAIVTVVYSIATIYIFPDMKDKMLEMQRTELAKSPQMTDEMIDQSMGFMKKGWNYFLVGGAILGTLLMGALFSLIAAAVAKKNPAPTNF